MSRRVRLNAALGSWLLALGMAAAAAGEAHAATYSSRALIEHAKLLDGKKVTYRGEAVTAVMKRGDNAWVNVNDGDNAVGVWCPAAMIAPVRFLGDYKYTGDTIEVEGVFNRACNEHGGELDVHAERVKVLKHGFARREETDVRKLAAAFLFFALVLGVTVVFRKRI